MINSVVCYILCSAFFFNAVYSISVNECSQGGLVPEEVIVDGCEANTTICHVQFNGIFNMTMKFKAPHYLESMKPSLVGKTALGELQLNGESSNEDVCKGILNTFCPLVAKELIEYRYSVKLVVLPLFQCGEIPNKLPITMEFSILDLELNETAICFKLVVIPTIF